MMLVQDKQQTKSVKSGGMIGVPERERVIPRIASVAMKLTSMAVSPTTLMLVVWGMRSWQGSILPAVPLLPVLTLKKPAVQGGLSGELQQI